MSSEIRAGESRTYWIISNGNSYVDGVTDPGLVTTVGNGWHMYWIGSDYSEYLTACQNCNIIPRNNNPEVSIISSLPNDKISARQARLWLLNKGIDLNRVNEAIYSIEDTALRASVSIEWEYAPYIERSHPILPILAHYLGLTENDIDIAFIEGSQI